MPSPILPPEIWRFILRYATETPGLLDTSPLPPLCDDRRSWSFNEWPLRNDLATKSSLTLVCAQWYSIGVEFLFEYISISQIRTLVLLTQSLEKSAGRNSNAARDARPLGWRIKRLDFHLNFVVKTPPFAYSFNQLLRLCVDLQYVSLQGNLLPTPVVDISALIERAPSLRACSVSGAASRSIFSHLLQFCKELQRFNAIAFLSLTFDNSIVSIPGEPVTLQNLHTLEIDFADYNRIALILDTIADWNLPSLRSLDLTADSNEPDPFTPFLRSHGAKITTLKLQIFDGMDKPITSITRLCPSVVDLGFDLFVLDESLPSLPDLRRISLLGETEPGEAHAFDRALEFIFANNQPKLECIRLEEFYLRDIGFLEWCGEFVSDWASVIGVSILGGQVRLESGDGVLIKYSQLAEGD
jgi:hypothetical protein